MKNILKITGIGYLIIFITGFYSNFFVLESVFVPGNGSKTISNLIQNEILFRTGIIGFVIMVAFDLLLAWTLYLLMKQINEKLSLLSAWLRLVNAAIFGVALFNLLNAVQIAVDPLYTGLLSFNELYAHVMINFSSFNNLWLIGLIFFGFHLLLLGYLVYKSGFALKTIGVLLQIAGIGYLVDSTAHFLMPDYKEYQDLFMMIVLLPGIVGEFSFTVWLLIKGFGKKQLSF